MEIILKDLSYFKYLSNININFKENMIYGLYGKHADYLIKILNKDITNYKGEIISDKEYSSFIISDDDYVFYTTNVKDEFHFIADNYGLDNGNIRQNAVEIFYKLNIDEDLYDRDIVTLSRSEKYLVKICLGLFLDSDLIIFKNIFNGLDLKNIRILKTLIKNISSQKIIIFLDDDSNILYNETDYVYIFKNDKVVLFGSTNDIFTDVKRLNVLKIKVPYLSDIAYKVKQKKGIKLIYRKDVRDIMKDIYRNV